MDELVDLSKILLKEVKGLHKSIKAWRGYEGLEAMVKNMMTSLPLVSELHRSSPIQG